jgi:hypothetical protein
MIRMNSVEAQKQTAQLRDAARREAVAELEAWSATACGAAGKAARGLTDDKVCQLVHKAR